MRGLVVIAALLTGLSACNTVEGMGQDISEAARTVRNSF